ncbi:fyve, rhogef and ph domain-containing protein 6 [Plakobranchus ocellatus]|uniref:Fyve, rhogef and ph domain-containing protein 6 n=1 Tax=Plakobranchus ocellatus TaxID=259542 RepID=A0AAV3Z6H6_9GAST|nr:fyve, rhogef and ph domain-containing protein 6 [Plakobranchus ocellatus]
MIYQYLFGEICSILIEDSIQVALSEPGQHCKPLVAAKPSRRPAPPPPPPKPQSLKLAINSHTLQTFDPNTVTNKRSCSLENGTAEETEAVTAEMCHTNGAALAQAGCRTNPPPRPPLPTSPPPIQRKGPMSPSSSASLPASFRSQQSKSSQRHSASQIKNSPSLHSMPAAKTFDQCLQKAKVNLNSSPQIKTSPPKGPKPPVPPKIAAKFKKHASINVQNTHTNQSNDTVDVCKEETLQEDEVESLDLKTAVGKEHNSDFTLHKQSKPCLESNPNENSDPSLCLSPIDTELPVPIAPSNIGFEQTPSLPKSLETSSPPFVNLLESGKIEQDPLKQTPKKSVPPPLPKHPPRGGLPRKPRASVNKKPPEQAASPKPCSDSVASIQQSEESSLFLSLENPQADDISLGIIESIGCAGSENVSSPAGPQSTQRKANLGESTQADQNQQTPPKPRPRTRISIPFKPAEEEEKLGVQDELEEDGNKHDPEDRPETSCFNPQTSFHNLTKGETDKLLKNCQESSSSQENPELDYAEVYRGDDEQKPVNNSNGAFKIEPGSHKVQVSGSVSHVGLSNQEPESTCGMLKEIEDLLNKKLVDLDQNSDDHSDRDNNQDFSLNTTNNDSFSADTVSLSSSPQRPPRPKHQASIARRQDSVDSLISLSQSGSCESLTSSGTLKKVGPPKPKRTSLPRVSRSYSDASGLKYPTDNSTDSENLGGTKSHHQTDGKPYLPPRLESLKKDTLSSNSSSGCESPPPLPPRNRSHTSSEISSSADQEPPPLPERVSLVLPLKEERDSKTDDSCQEVGEHRSKEDMESQKKQVPPRPPFPAMPASSSNVTEARGPPENRKPSLPHRSSMPRPTRKAPPPPATAPCRSSTFAPGDAKPLTSLQSRNNLDVKSASSNEEPDYHEIPAEVPMRRDPSPPPRLPPRVTRSKSVCSGEAPAIEIREIPSKDEASRGKDKKSSSLERHSSLKLKLKKEEQNSREKKAKTALIQRVTQGLGLRKSFKKSKSPESSSSKASDSCDSSELEADDCLPTSVDHSAEVHPRKKSVPEEEGSTSSSNLTKDDAEATIVNKEDFGVSQTSDTTDTVMVDVCPADSNHTEKQEEELPSPAMERLGMEDLESEVMSALSSGIVNTIGITSSPVQVSEIEGDSSVDARERPESFRSGRSTSTSSEREPGDEAQEEQDGEAISSASDSEPEPEQDKEEIYDFRLHISEATEKLSQPVIPSEMMNKILAFLPQLQNFNEDLLKDLSDRVNDWEENPRLSDIFVKKGPFLKLYSSYIRNFETSTATLDEAIKRHPHFAAALKEFEMSPRCASLALKHYMLKPIQRIPQYKLLLQDYLKQLSPESADFKDTLTALNIVSEVADHANESMRHGDNVQKLLEIQRSLVGSFEVIQPGRFSDVLLYTTPVTTGNKINNILPLIGMKVISPKLEDHENEFNIISVQRSFTLCASTPELKQQWVTALHKAIEENAQRHNTFETVKQGPQTSLLDKDFVLGHKAPLWVPDARVTMCMLCLVEFTLTWRRHHCRSCGRIICAQCSQNKAPLRYLKYKPSRVCDECFDKLKEDLAKEVNMEKRKRKSIPAEEDPNTSATDDGTSNISIRDVVDGEAALQATIASEMGEQHESGLSLHSLLNRFTKIRGSNNRQQRRSGNYRPSVLKEVHANDEGSDMSGYLYTFKSRKWKKMWFVLKGKVLYTYKASAVHANDEGSDMSGYLYTFKSRKWKKMWFVLKGKVLYTYKASADMAAVESMPLLGYEVSEFDSYFEGAEPNLLIELRHQNNQPLTSRASSGATVASRNLTGAERATQRTVLKTDSAASTIKYVFASVCYTMSFSDIPHPTAVPLVLPYLLFS